MTGIEIRPLKVEDIEAASSIQERITKKPTPEHWKDEIRDHIRRSRNECLAAEIDGNLVGFIIGEAKTLEFGLDRSGWIVAIAVDPEFMGQGVGRALGKALLERFESQNIKEVYTAVRWDSSDLLAFFKSIGFKVSQFVSLERRTGDD